MSIPNPEPEKQVTLSPKGSWGQVEYYEVPLPCPEEAIRMVTLPSQQTEWIFPNLSMEGAQTFLTESGLDAQTTASLFDGKSAVPGEANGTRIFPPDELVYSLPPQLRTRVYSRLADSTHNRFYTHPIYLNDGNLSRWFQGSGLPDRVIRDVARLAYPTPAGRGYFLSDVPYLLRSTETAQDEKTLLKALLRRPALIVRLRIDSDTDIDSLADYWTSGYKYKDVLPLMESVSHTEGIDKLEIAHLLPPDPRMRLNTFPTSFDGLSGRFPDWFWTCYNFFRFNPREVYADSEERDVILSNEFYPVIPPYSFGDLLLLRSGSKIVHGCIYVVDDIVYTKNSADIFSPWILMKIDDVVAYHSNAGSLEVQGYKKR